MKQRTITFVIILLVFLSIFSANYEVLNKIRSSKIIQSEILNKSTDAKTDTSKGICENSGTIEAMRFIGTSSFEIISTNF